MSLALIAVRRAVPLFAAEPWRLERCLDACVPLDDVQLVALQTGVAEPEVDNLKRVMAGLGANPLIAAMQT